MYVCMYINVAFSNFYVHLLLCEARRRHQKRPSFQLLGAEGMAALWGV